MDMWRSFFFEVHICYDHQGFVPLSLFLWSDALVTESLKHGVPGVTLLGVWISSKYQYDQHVGKSTVHWSGGVSIVNCLNQLAVIGISQVLLLRSRGPGKQYA